MLEEIKRLVGERNKVKEHINMEGFSQEGDFIKEPVDEFEEMDILNARIGSGDEPFVEFALINPKLNKSIKKPIYIGVPQGEEGPIPHIHVYHDSSRSVRRCSFIRLDKAEYSSHHNVVRLPRELQKSFLEVLTTIWPNYHVTEKSGKDRPATGYEAAVDFWLDTQEPAKNIKFEIDEKTGIWIMPPYDKLFKK